MSNKKVKWLSRPPEKCDICSCKIKNRFIDGATLMGPWAFMCKDCHKTEGRGLGLGRGQEFVKDKDTGEFFVKSEKMLK